MLGRRSRESTVRRVNKLKALKPDEWLIVAGGALVLVFALFRWFTWEVDNAGVRLSGKSNAFDYFVTGFVPWVLVVGAAVITLLLATEALSRGKLPWHLILLAATALGFVLILIRLIVGDDPNVSGTDVDVDVSRGIGIWISALGALIAFVGAFIGFRNTGLEAEYKPVVGRSQPDRQIPPSGDATAP
jgi:hypothetical protein